MEKETLQKWLASPVFRRRPENVKAIGELQGPDGKTMAALFFSTERDIIVQIGVEAGEGCSDLLKAALAAAAMLAEHKAVMAADLIGPDQLLETLGSTGSDEDYYAALMAVLTLKNALHSYADYRAMENRRDPA
jgi:hypothetical protein